METGPTASQGEALLSRARRLKGIGWDLHKKRKYYPADIYAGEEHDVYDEESP